MSSRLVATKGERGRLKRAAKRCISRGEEGTRFRIGRNGRGVEKCRALEPQRRLNLEQRLLEHPASFPTHKSLSLFAKSLKKGPVARRTCIIRSTPFDRRRESAFTRQKRKREPCWLMARANCAAPSFLPYMEPRWTTTDT